MKKQILIGSMYLMSAFMLVNAQGTGLPDVPLYTLDGKEISTSSIKNDGMPMIMTFWKTYENDCCEQLIQLCSVYNQILKPQGVKMVAICIDGKGCSQHVKPFVKGRDITIDVYIDKNGDLERAIGVFDAPYNVLFDQDMKIYCRHAGPCASIEDMVCQKVNECLAAMKKK
jgi:hypothetical protein